MASHRDDGLAARKHTQNPPKLYFAKRSSQVMMKKRSPLKSDGTDLAYTLRPYAGVP